MSLVGLVLSFACLQQARRPERKEPDAPRAFVSIEVTCTALAGDSAYIDAGREAGIAPGDRLRIFPFAGLPLGGRISSVSRTSARAEIDGGVAGLDLGSRGEVWVPRERLEATREKVDAPVPVADGSPAPEPGARLPVGPEHPPWTSPPEEWTSEQPLLAPAHGLAPEDRERRFRGRLSASLDGTLDRAGAESRDYQRAALAFDGRLDNPFGQGGRLELDAEAFARRSDEDGAESKLRLDRASHSFGHERGARTHGEVGRFLQNELPALGFLDGVELVHALGPGHRLGASLGFLPIPDDLFSSGEDLQVALFWRAGDVAESGSFAAGYQKTWHEGAADRDLLVGELELHADGWNSLFASALVDLYTSGDELKDSGPELTQMFLSALHRTAAGHGASLFLSRYRWPELERDEFPDVTAEEIAAAASTRAGTDGWIALGRHTLYARAELWSDEDDSGAGGRLRSTWRDLPRPGDLLLAEVFANEGKFTDAIGLRASARRRLERGSVELAWDSTRSDHSDVDEELLQHAVRASIDLRLGPRWTIAAYAESRFGDEQDALSLGLLLQRSFD
jgi:hypothetical protein